MLYIAELIDPEDPSYLCEITVIAGSEDEAKAFLEKQNPGKVAINVKLVEQST